MASYKLNIARIRGCSPVKEVVKVMGEFGLPKTEEYGVLNYSSSSEAAFATIIRRSQQAVKQVDADTREVTSAPVEKVTLYPLAVMPQQELLEIYAGSASGIEQVGMFFSGCLAMHTVTEAIEIDIPAAVEKLAKLTQKFQLRSVRVTDFSHNSFMAGPYTPKFMDTQHGLEFLEEYAESAAAASVRFSGPTGKVTVTLSPKACFGFSCNEDDQPTVQTLLRKLV